MADSRSVPERMATGVDGLDRLVNGGLAVLGLQSLCQAAAEGVAAILVTLGETAREITANRAAFAWCVFRSIVTSRSDLS